jgi:hypothetical protein
VTLLVWTCDLIQGALYMFAFFLVVQLVASGLSWAISYAADAWQNRNEIK